MDSWYFYRHMQVYLDTGRHLGRVEEVGHAADYIHVQQGHILIYDWYIPTRAIREVDASGVRLAVSLAALRENCWNIPPETFLMRQGATPGYEYTGPTDVSTYSRVEGYGSAHGKERG
ncbi:MAG: hypothetical protein ACR2JC_12665 [Chloroflexota bacterium]